MAWRTRWLLYAVLALIPVAGALAGGVVANSKPPVYSAEARLSVVLTDLNTAEQMASNYSRYLVRDSVAAEMNPSAASSLIDLKASPIPDSNMIRVEATAFDPTTALAAAKAGTTALKERVTQLSGGARAKQTLAEYTTVSRLVAQAQERVNASAGRGAGYTTNAPKLATLQAQADALKAKYQSQTTTGAASTELSLVQAAAPTGDDRTSRKHIYQLAGLGAGALIAYILGRLLTGLGAGLAARRFLDRSDRGDRGDRNDRGDRRDGADRGGRAESAPRPEPFEHPEPFDDPDVRDPVPAYATRPAPAPRRLDLDDIPPLLDDPRPVPAAHVAEAAARSTPPAPRVAQRPVAPAGRGPARAATAPVPTAPDPSDPPRRASSGHPAVRPNSAEPDRVPARREPAPLAPSYPGRGQQRLGPRRGAPGPAVESPRRRTDWP